jgi:hypothetical protein
MKKFVLYGATLLMCSMLAVAQTPDKVCEVNRVVPKPGATQQLEAGRKTHNAFHAAQKDKYEVLVWSILSGPATGQYLMTTCGMGTPLSWAAMDRPGDFDAKDQADIARTFGQYTSGTATSYYIQRDDIGGKKAEPDAKLPKMISITTFYLKGDGGIPFTAAAKRIYEAIVKSNYPTKVTTWYQLANGGEGPQFVQVSDRNTWSDMQGPDKTLQAMLEEVYGKDDTTLQTLRAQIRYTVSELAELRQDLSYIPAK